MRIFDKENINRIYFVLILLLAVGVRLFLINRSLWSDEIFSVLGAKTSLLNLRQYLIANESHPPFMYILLHVWMFFFTNEWGIRLLFVLFGVGSTVLMYAIGTRFVNEDFGLLAMLLYSVSPFAIWSAQEVRAYVLGVFFCLASMYYFLVMVQEKRFNVRAFVLYAFSAAASLYSFYFNIFIIAGCGLFLLVRLHKYGKVFVQWLWSVCLAGVLLIPLYPIFFDQMDLIEGHNVVLSQRGVYLLGVHIGTPIKAFFSTITGLDPLFWENPSIFLNAPLRYLYLAVAALLILFIVTGIRKSEKRLRWRSVDLWLFVIPAFLPALLAFLYEFLFKGGVVARYFVISSALFCFVLAAIAFTAGKRRHAVIIVGVMVLFMLLRMPWIYSPKQDWKDAASYVKKNFKKNDLVVAIFSNRLSFGYYFNIPVDLYTVSNLIKKTYVKSRNAWTLSMTPEDEAKFLALVSPPQTVWAVFSSGQRQEEEGFADTLFYKADFRNVGIRKFQGVDVIVYSRQRKILQ